MTQPSPPLIPPHRGHLAFDLALLVLVAVVSFVAFHGAGSNDLRALWIAATNVSQGRPELIYPPHEALFTMQPPPEWLSVARSQGHSGEIYPYIYPPLWAWLLVPVSKIVPFSDAAAVMRAFNGAALVGCVLLARRLVVPEATPAQHRSFVVAGLAALMLTHVGFVGLYENQPQILVSLLTLAGLERAENRAQFVGGMLLALAAALKAYPALLALMWLASGQRRAFVAFLGTGAALAALSVGLAGWPTHRAFLDVLSAISHTILLAPISMTFDATLAQFLWSDRFTFVPNLLSGDESGGWFVLAKPALLLAFDKFVLPATLALFAIAFYRRRARSELRVLLWPATMAALSYVAPLAWSVHYIAPMAALGLVTLRLGRRGVLLTMAIVALLGAFLLPLGSSPTWPHVPAQMLGSLGIAMLIGAFVQAALARGDGNRAALQQSDLRASET